MWYAYKIMYYSVLSKDAILCVTFKWTVLSDIMLKEIKQTLKQNVVYSLSYVESKKNPLEHKIAINW